jgi:hypothetical protein
MSGGSIHRVASFIISIPKDFAVTRSAIDGKQCFLLTRAPRLPFPLQ